MLNHNKKEFKRKVQEYFLEHVRDEFDGDILEDYAAYASGWKGEEKWYYRSQMKWVGFLKATCFGTPSTDEQEELIKEWEESSQPKKVKDMTEYFYSTIFICAVKPYLEKRGVYYIEVKNK